MSHILEINRKYLEQFKNRLKNRVSALIRTTDSSVLKSLILEVNRLFTIISGRLVSKLDIPKPHEFPDSVKFNSFLEDLDIDIDKLYNARGIIESDIQNVANYNSLEREKTIQNLSKVQKKVYSAYIKSKKSMSGTTIIREEFKDDNLPNASTGVMVNMDKESLTLNAMETNISREEIDRKLVDITFVEFPPEKYNVYPNNKSFSLGSFWKLKGGVDVTDYHWHDVKNKLEYRERMTDHIGSTLFEAVVTFDNGNLRNNIETELTQQLNVHKNFIMVDRKHSLFGDYMSLEDITKDSRFNKVKCKLIIPLNARAKAATSFIIIFEGNDSNEIPNIDKNMSYAYDTNNRKVKIKHISRENEDKSSKIGRYHVDFAEPIIPSRIELILFYSSSCWSSISQYIMHAYDYTNSKTIYVNATVGNVTDQIKVVFTRKLVVCVDKELRSSAETARVNKVLQLKGVIK